jgi:hypothetical protein
VYFVPTVIEVVGVFILRFDTPLQYQYF